MKKRIVMFFQITCFSFVLILLLSYLSGVLTASELLKHPARNQYWQTLNAEDRNTIDVIFTGDSTVSNAVIPVQIWEQTGITSYLNSYASMKPQESYFDLKRIFEKQSPKYVIIEASYLMKITSAEDKYLTKKAKSCVNFFENEITGAIDYYFPVMRYKSVQADLTLEDFITMHPQKINSIYKSYLYSSRSEAFDPEKLKLKEGSVVFVDNADIYLQKICNLCKKNNCKVILVALPQIKKWNYAYNKKITELANKYGIPFVDFHIDMDEYIEDFSWQTDTKDGGSHLNYRGAKKTTTALGEYLVNNLGLLPSILTDKQSEKWNNDTALFYETTGKKPIRQIETEDFEHEPEHIK